MNIQTTLFIVAIKTIGLILGSLITYYAYKGYRRTGDRSLLWLTSGFGVVTAGFAFAGLLDQLLPVSAEMAIAVNSLFTSLGFAIVLYSLYR